MNENAKKWKKTKNRKNIKKMTENAKKWKNVKNGKSRKSGNYQKSTFIENTKVEKVEIIENRHFTKTQKVEKV